MHTILSLPTCPCIIIPTPLNPSVQAPVIRGLIDYLKKKIKSSSGGGASTLVDAGPSQRFLLAHESVDSVRAAE